MIMFFLCSLGIHHQDHCMNPNDVSCLLERDLKNNALSHDKAKKKVSQN